MRLPHFVSVAAIVAVSGFASPLPAPAVSFAPACSTSALALAVSPSNDNGMLHDAVVLTLTNTSAAACSVPGHPHVSLFDASGKAIVADASTPPLVHVHPGPVIVPRDLAAGSSVQTEIRWLRDSGNATSAACSPVATVALEGARAPLATKICGDAARNFTPACESADENATVAIKQQITTPHSDD